MSQHLTDQNKRSVFASGLILFAANLLPLIAVWKHNWTCYDLLVLYWTETILIGVINIFRMIIVNPQGSTPAFHLLKIAYIPFFAGHFGMFCVGIGLGMQVLFGEENFEVRNQIIQMLSGKSKLIFWPLVISHIFSYCWNFIAQREFKRTSVLRRMFAPYLRVIPVMAFAVGATYGCIYLQMVMWASFAFIGGKLLIDLLIHVIMHFKLIVRKEQRRLITVRD